MDVAVASALSTIAGRIAAELREDLHEGRKRQIGYAEIREAITAREHCRTLGEREVEHLEEETMRRFIAVV
jgi:hypothetical protein